MITIQISVNIKQAALPNSGSFLFKFVETFHETSSHDMIIDLHYFAEFATEDVSWNVSTTITQTFVLVEKQGRLHQSEAFLENLGKRLPSGHITEFTVKT